MTSETPKTTTKELDDVGTDETTKIAGTGLLSANALATMNRFIELASAPDLPSRLFIQRVPWSVEERSRGDLFELGGVDLLGYCLLASTQLLVLESMPPAMKASILFHEALHAILDINGIDLSEAQVRTLGNTLFTFIAENGEFIEYINETTT